MIKPTSLRAAIEAALPHLKKNPDKLLMYIDSGSVASGLTRPGFEYRYTVTIDLLDFDRSTDAIMIPLLQWVRSNEPMLLQNPDTSKEAITFEAEIQSHSSYDLRLQVKLSECVNVSIAGADAKAVHLPEPQIGEYPQIERVQIYHNGELIDDSAEL